MLKIEANINRLIEYFMRDEDIPGLSIGIFVNKELLFTKGYGVKDIEKE